MKSFQISPKTDIVFKRIFGDDRNKDVLADFLSAVLDVHVDPESIVFAPEEQAIENATEKVSIYDVRARIADKTDIDIEIQLANAGNMADRSLYDWGKLFTRNLVKSDDYSQLRRAVTINILDFRMFSDERFCHAFSVREDTNGQLLTDKLQMYFLELKKARLDAVENNKLLQWMLFIGASNRDEEVLQMLSQKNEKIRKAADTLDILSKDEAVYGALIAREKAERDMNQRIHDARDEGMVKGRTEGKIEMAKNLLKSGIPIATIVKASGLTESEIKKFAQ